MSNEKGDTLHFIFYTKGRHLPRIPDQEWVADVQLAKVTSKEKPDTLLPCSHLSYNDPEGGPMST